MFKEERIDMGKLDFRAKGGCRNIRNEKVHAFIRYQSKLNERKRDECKARKGGRKKEKCASANTIKTNSQAPGRVRIQIKIIFPENIKRLKFRI